MPAATVRLESGSINKLPVAWLILVGMKNKAEPFALSTRPMSFSKNVGRPAVQRIDVDLVDDARDGSLDIPGRVLEDVKIRL